GGSRFRLSFMDRVGNSQPPPADLTVSVDTIRSDGSYRRYAMASRGSYLESSTDVPRPHEFVAKLEIEHEDHEHTFDTRFGDDRQRESERGAKGQIDPGDFETMDAHQRSHAVDIQRRFAGRNVTTGQVILFGLSGGLLPCPAAVTVLLL